MPTKEHRMGGWNINNWFFTSTKIVIDQQIEDSKNNCEAKDPSAWIHSTLTVWTKSQQSLHNATNDAAYQHCNLDLEKQSDLRQKLNEGASMKSIERNAKNNNEPNSENKNHKIDWFRVFIPNS